MDLKLIVALALLLWPLVLVLPLEPLRIPLGLLLVLFAPGYVLLAALFPRKEPLSGLERVALSVGLSLAIVPLTGLALNFSPWGLRLLPILTALTVLTLALAALAWRVQRGVPPEERFEVRWAPIAAWARGLRTSEAAFLVLLVLAVGGLIGGMAWRVQHPAPGQPFTQFYVLGKDGLLRDYVTQLQVGQPQEYTLGIGNHEGRTARYTIRALLDGQDVGAVGPLELQDGETWEDQIVITPETAGELRLEFLLYLEGSAEAYRDLHLQVTVSPN